MPSVKMIFLYSLKNASDLPLNTGGIRLGARTSNEKISKERLGTWKPYQNPEVV